METDVRGEELPGGATISQVFVSFLERLGEITGIDTDSIKETFRGLEASGIAGMDAINQMLDGIVPGMEESLRSLIENMLSVGEFGENVSGAVESLRFFRHFLDEDLPTSFDRFITFLLDNVEGLDKELRSLLKEAAGLDITDEAGRARLAEIVRIVAASVPEFLGGLTTSDLTAILDELKGFAEGGPTGAGETISSQIQRTITEFQANALLDYQREQVYLLGRIVGLLDPAQRVSGQIPNFTLPTTPEGYGINLPSYSSGSMVPGSTRNGAGALYVTFQISGSTVETILEKVEERLRTPELFG